MHLVGIGGAGMSAIATVLIQMGYRVRGSDIKESPNVRRLRNMGAVVGVGHRPGNLQTPELVIRSSAIGEENPEIVEARRRGVRVVDRAEMLAAIMDKKKGIAVAGTHGKTTTTSIVTHMLLDCGADPSYLIGGELNETGGNAHFGGGELLVAEADESDGSLLYLEPELVILTNVDGDHLDYFQDLEHTESVFSSFMRRMASGGSAVVCGDDPGSARVGRAFAEEGGTVCFYGRGGENDYRFTDENVDTWDCSFKVLEGGDELAQVKVKVPGLHNIYNALASFAAGHRLGFTPEELAAGIASFGGVRRRFERVGEAGGVMIVDDYAHHPTEIEAVLRQASRLATGRVVVVFQPHRYSRTRLLADGFGSCFTGADLLVITDVYGAGEYPEPGITGRLVVERVLAKDPGRDVVYLPNRSELASSVAPMLKEGDLVMTVGAGDITQCSRELLEILGGGARSGS